MAGRDRARESVRGTISNRLKTRDRDPAKLDASIQSPNLQTVDVANLPSDADTLEVRFTLRVLGGAGTPSACNDAAYRDKLLQTVAAYVNDQGFAELARRYAHNLANARFLWRNRVGAEAVEVRISHIRQGEVARAWRFDALAIGLRDFKADAELDALAELIASGLSGSGHVLLEVVAFARIGDGQEVFPSQELILDKGDKKGQKSKTLYSVRDAAAIHSQKIGNALRTIDTWYPDEDGLGPIAVEPYGSVTSQGKAYRQPKQKLDFYTLLDNWVLRDEAPAVEQQHYVIANLIRGGVFGEAEESKPWTTTSTFACDRTRNFPGATHERALRQAPPGPGGTGRGQDRRELPRPRRKPLPAGRTPAHSCLGGRPSCPARPALAGRVAGPSAIRRSGSRASPTPYRQVSRVQAKSNPERLRRRLMRRHDLSEEEARKRIPDTVARTLDLPFVTLRSQSTGQHFRLFIRHGPLQATAEEGGFTCYRLSKGGFVPWF